MSIARLVALLSRAGLDPVPAEVADALWLARYLPAAAAREPVLPVPAAGPVVRQVPHVPGGTDGVATDRDEAAEPGLFDLVVRPRDADPVVPTVPIMVPAATALPGKLALGRALRHLRRAFPDRRRLVVDEERTATRVAEEGIWAPVLRPAMERWWDVSLVVDAEPSMRVWAQLVSELSALLGETGAFRDVRTWSLHSTGPGGPGVSPGTGTRGLRPPAELVDPAHRRLVLVVSDCVGRGWHDGTVGAVLWRWAHTAPVVVLQPLPQRMWARTGARPVRGRVRARTRGVANSGLRFAVDQRRPRLPPGAIPVPLLQIDPDWVRPWAALVAGTAVGWVDSAMTLTTASPATETLTVEPIAAPSDVRVKTYLASTSPEAFTLACYLATVPLTLPVMRLVQRVMLPASRPSHLAEVLLSGLLTTVPDDPRRYEFAEGVRAELAGYLARGDLRRLRSALSRFCADRLGLSVREFHAAVSGPTAGADDGPDGVGTRFGYLPSALLTRLGGRYRELVDLFAAEPQRRDEDLTAAIAEAADALDGGVTNADEAIRLYRRAFALAGTEVPRAAAAGLVRALRVRYGALGDATDLTEALDLEERALAPAGPPSAGLQADLADLRLAQYDHTGRMADLDRAVQLLRSACAHTKSTEQAWLTRHAVLAVALGKRFDRAGDVDDLTAAVDAQRRAIHPNDESRHWRVLFDLAELLRRRFEVTRGRADLDEAVRIYHNLAAWAPDAALVAVLRALVSSLVARFHEGGNDKDLAQAEGWAREVTLIGGGQAHGTDLAVLATLLFTRFDRSGDLAALTESVRLCRQVLELTAPHDPERPAHLHRLGHTTQARYDATGDPLDLVESVQAWRDAVEVTQPDHPGYVGLLASLGRALSAKAGQTGPRLDEAIAAFERAVVLTPPEAKGYRALSLALTVLRIRSGLTDADAVATGEAAVRAHRQALGDDHLDTLRARFDIAAALLDAGHHAAVSDLAAVLEDQIRVLGAGHPDTEATRRALEQVR